MGKGLGLGKTSAPPTLPAPFQSVAQQAFDFGNEPEKKPAQPARGIASRMLGRLKLRYRVALSFGVAAAGGVILTFAAMMVYYTVAFPDPLALRNNDRAPLIRILARDGTTIAERGAAREYVRLSDLPKLIPAAVVATEDRRFFDHYGVDPIGMFRAMFANLRAGRFAQGGSTLTQQLAKNLFLTQERTLTRKVAELGLALWLEIRLSKEEILELYLNQCYFGSGAYGVGAASQRYFGKPARSLNLAEAAVIAGLLKAPSKYSPATNPDAARERGRVVLSRMLDAGFISPEQEKIALAQPVLFADPKTTVVAPDTGYVVDYILDQMPPISHTANGEVIVQTTLDRDLQRSAQRIVKETLARKGAAFGASQAALIVLDRDGGIRALVGGRDYAESQFDRAVKAKRQPGSAFKPFVYLAALDQGMTPDTVAFDGPITIGGWSPKNDNNKYGGEITLRQALAQSVNTVAVRLNQDVGQGRTIDVARRLGIRSDLHEGPSLALGTSEVSLLEMSGAYAVFSNGGEAVEPHIISQVRVGNGPAVYVSPPPRTDRVASLDEIGALNDMLNAVVVYGTGRRAALPDQPAAGKTGTTQDFRDAWFIGYTSHLTAGVWVGNDNGKPMIRTTGGSLPAEIWNQIMRVAHQGMVPEPLPGTVVSRPGPDALDGFGDASFVSNGPRVPRVVQYHEVLPWAARSTVEDATRSRSDMRAKAAPLPLSHPMSNIGDDFIARALADEPERRPEAMAADEPIEAGQGIASFGIGDR
ncbi:penicillin-binding protein, 1A family [Hyphomicrobium denitrificans 1NES1]|uniref:Penicillin-binding protein, 1A family n=1 Tax=Hyphomicrobium denitrificans 1NES1 TaxID=670307 RepID=N0B6N7_9HYPH|nr:penicillin-binding protein 1A [Hyphomicrobium denitrificans]AGK56201.1 penicillin-binding protein, 1A family [Hyphomicrobium denitrificans 1NES1]